MPSFKSVAYYLAHPIELRAMIQWKLWHQPVHARNEESEGPDLRRCFYFLDFTSRSFAAVIKELHPELLVPICLFYLTLRGLDTIEDDMTIPLATKDPILRSFDQILEQPGWSFDGNHSKEKDRDMLVEFHCVIAEFAKIKEPYRVIIKDIAKRMGNGMADYCSNAEFNENGVDSIANYQLYCHYVAGLVGEGCTRLFVEAKLAKPALLEKPELMESMGQFLQQTNITRDVREDWDEKRRFWPKEIWSKYVDNFDDLFKPENRNLALNCSSEMVHTALTRVEDCLFFLAGLKEQSVFNFCAIPQVMAIATLDLCYRNYEMFERNVKITKGQACINIMESTGNLQMVCNAFKRYARSIHHKGVPEDPHYFKMSVTCGKIEQFIESIFPSQKRPQTGVKQQGGKSGEFGEVALFALASLAMMLVCSGIMAFIAYMFGARFDLVWHQISGTVRQLLSGSMKAGAEKEL